MPNETFNQYVTRTKFNLSLTQRQMELLCAFYETESYNEAHGLSDSKAALHPGIEYSFYIPTVCCLKDKGLIEHTGKRHRLTQAGLLVALLLKEAGLFYAPWHMLPDELRPEKLAVDNSTPVSELNELQP